MGAINQKIENDYFLNFFLIILQIQFRKNSDIAMTNLQTFKFVFTAYLGEMNIKAKISSPTFVTWKRSQQSATSQVVELIEGKANFNSQVLKLPVSMYYDKDANCFQEKKSSFSFTMKTPKGEKTAGVVYVDLSKMLNNKLNEINEDFPLQKCPVKDSTVRIKIVSQCLGQKSNDTMSQASINLTGAGVSTISIPEGPTQPSSKQKIEIQPSTTSRTSSKDEQIKALKRMLQQLTKQNQNLKKQLQRTKESVKGDNLKEELLKSKSLQDKLEEEVNNLRKQNLQHQKQLEDVRLKMESAYTNLYSNLSKHFL